MPISHCSIPIVAYKYLEDRADINILLLQKILFKTNLSMPLLNSADCRHMTYPCFQEDHHPGHDKRVDMQSKGIACRIKKCACELLSIGNDLMDDAYSWDLMGRDIRLKSMFLYCDLSQLISNVPKDQKKALTEVGNKLFSSIEELDHAVKIHSIPLIRDRYNEASVILQELMVLMP